MKEWKKPEIVDLDVKFTEEVPFTTSGGECTPPNPGSPTCDECGKELHDLTNFHNENNHKGWCSHFKHRENPTCGR